MRIVCCETRVRVRADSPAIEGSDPLAIPRLLQGRIWIGPRIGGWALRGCKGRADPRGVHSGDLGRGQRRGPDRDAIGATAEGCLADTFLVSDRNLVVGDVKAQRSRGFVHAIDVEGVQARRAVVCCREGGRRGDVRKMDLVAVPCAELDRAAAAPEPVLCARTLLPPVEEPLLQYNCVLY